MFVASIFTCSSLIIPLMKARFVSGESPSGDLVINIPGTYMSQDIYAHEDGLRSKNTGCLDHYFSKVFLFESP